MSNNADDTDPGFSYSGNWQTLTGSTRQWQGTVHSTTQSGASATFRFVGTAARVYFTVPAGSGSSMADISLDGVTRTVSKTSHSDNFYDDLWFDSGLISNTQHTVVVTNRGSDGGTPLQFDRIAFDGTIIAPPSPPPAPVAPTTTRSVVVTRTTTTDVSSSISTSQSSSSTRSGSSTSTGSSSSSSSTSDTNARLGQTVDHQTVTAVQFITTSADGAHSSGNPGVSGGASSHSSSDFPLGAIVGIVIGGIIVLLLLLLLFCLRRRRRRSSDRHMQLSDDAGKSRNVRTHKSTVTPFNLDKGGSASSHRSTRDTMASSNTHLVRKTSQQSDGAISNPSTTSALAVTSQSEKTGEYFSPISPSSSSSPLISSRNNTSVLPEIDAGPAIYRPRYLSGETIIPGTSTSMYASTMLGQTDTNDFPPSYQSVRNHNSSPHRHSSFRASSQKLG